MPAGDAGNSAPPRRPAGSESNALLTPIRRRRSGPVRGIELLVGHGPNAIRSVVAPPSEMSIVVHHLKHLGVVGPRGLRDHLDGGRLAGEVWRLGMGVEERLYFRDAGCMG